MAHHSPDPLASDAAFVVQVKFSSVMLVCGDCEKRSNGPSRLSAKDVRKDFKHRLADTSHKFRIVQSSCLGLCPKKALAVVALPAGQPLVVAELKSEAEVGQFTSLILKSM
jgi:predicted metal-binding protein